MARALHNLINAIQNREDTTPEAMDGAIQPLSAPMHEQIIHIVRKSPFF
jgi:hypothetical protein